MVFRYIIHYTYLRARAGQVRPKHDCPRSLVRELLASSLETILEKLDVSTAAVTTFLVLDFILHDKWLVAEVNSTLEGGRDGVVGSLVLCDETLVALEEDFLGVFDLPLSDVAERLTTNRSLHGGFGGRPSLRPVVSELFKERSLDLSGLHVRSVRCSIFTFKRC